MALKLMPLADRVVVEALETEERTASGIILPETAKEKPMEGMIIAAGPGRWDEAGKKRVEMEVKLGDRVLYAKYSGTEVKLEGKKLLVIRESDILAVIG